MAYEVEHQEQEQEQARTRDRDPVKLSITVLAFPVLLGAMLVTRFSAWDIFHPEGFLSWATLILSMLTALLLGYTLADRNDPSVRPRRLRIARVVCIIVCVTTLLLYLRLLAMYFLAG
ncbi:phosphoglycerol transferase MdoB-like AlkP superfamily enzyme [Saccharopolyspora lacisalsi]|uniref:Phosphoglycerol transferase MdoB-like AlkP superfamily enzyme n=1 Tax=Halosaccharopolyspora lacisalsi TaxID=1000566 RepID=A0A839DWI2_9PSEU|nr:hypothetical protein [Halosaccharopolyspora lacisalsi]MBA8825119.1 phosphoglycerol transferase MdoB-like AlkP superfamily enzyme [Halosaccharopolyspora lacisalsi]